MAALYELSDEELAEEIRTLPHWDEELCAELCARAGMSKAWKNADQYTAENLTERAAEVLGVEIY